MTGRASHTVGGFLAMAALLLGLGSLRLLVDRPPGGELGLAWPAPEYAAFRWTALGVATTVGAALGAAGVLLQALLRNPLASPFILGISSGAGLAVMIVMYAAGVLGVRLVPGFGEGAAALAGALGTMLLVYALGRREGWLDPVTLVLAGVIVSAVCAAGMMLIQHLSPGGLRGDMVRWMFGRIPQGLPWTALAVVIALTLAGVAIAAFTGRAMDAATLGDEEARSVGLALGRLRVMLYLVAGVLTAATVAIAGPIGFVGLIAPHAARLLIGPRHGPLVVGASLCGGILLVAADLASQAIATRAGHVPVGIFTALIGGPSFLWLLKSGRGQA